MQQMFSFCSRKNDLRKGLTIVRSEQSVMLRKEWIRFYCFQHYNTRDERLLLYLAVKMIATNSRRRSILHIHKYRYYWVWSHKCLESFPKQCSICRSADPRSANFHEFSSKFTVLDRI